MPLETQVTTTKLEPKTWKRLEAGISGIEILAIMAITVLVAAMAVPIIQPALRHSRAESAVELVAGQMRLARQAAVDRRRLHRVTFTTPQEILVERQEIPSLSWTELRRIDLPREVVFGVVNGAPTTSGQTPDGYGALSAINFNGGTQVFFQPDGSAIDSTGQICSGIVYFGAPGYVETARALTLFGATGRIKPWRVLDGVWHQ